MTKALEFQKIFGDHLNFVKDSLLKLTMVVLVILLISFSQTEANEGNLE